MFSEAHVNHMLFMMSHFNLNIHACLIKLHDNYIDHCTDFRKDRKMALIQMSSVEEAVHSLVVSVIKKRLIAAFEIIKLSMPGTVQDNGQWELFLSIIIVIDMNEGNLRFHFCAIFIKIYKQFQQFIFAMYIFNMVRIGKQSNSLLLSSMYKIVWHG